MCPGGSRARDVVVLSSFFSLFFLFLPTSSPPPPAGRSQAQAPAQCGGDRWLSNPWRSAGGGVCVCGVKRPLRCSETQGGQLAWQGPAKSSAACRLRAAAARSLWRSRSGSRSSPPPPPFPASSPPPPPLPEIARDGCRLPD